MVIFLIFTCVDFFVLFANYQIAKHISYYYLERVRVEGCLTQSDENEMRNKYESVKLNIEDLQVTDSEGNVCRGEYGVVVEKDPVEPDKSKIEMKITLKPLIRPLLTAASIGRMPDNPGSEFRIKVGGAVLSEKVL